MVNSNRIENSIITGVSKDVKASSSAPGSSTHQRDDTEKAYSDEDLAPKLRNSCKYVVALLYTFG